MRIINCLVLLVFFVSASLFAQNLPISASMLKAYEKGTRDKSGSPGTNYWQNGGTYTVDIKFEPSSRNILGKAKIVYHNNSSDTLHEIHFKLYPNLYKKGVQNKSRIKEEDKGDGVKILSFTMNRKSISGADLVYEGTNMVVKDVQILPKHSTEIEIDYHYTLNKGSHVRTGQVDEGAFFIAYSIPRIAVYDDLDGWNTFSYNGSEEFYNDFNDFNVSISVPKNYVVWATGDHLNPKEVFQPTIAAKLQRAEKSSFEIDVIDSLDRVSFNVTANNKINTFKFAAQNVPDFAFSVSNHYLWKSRSVVVDSATNRRTRVDAVFNPNHKDYYEVLDFAWKTVEAMSFKFPKWPFPYNHMTVFDGLDQMEYPMMANDNPTDTREDGIALTIHEIFHTMFPFYMGTNETKYAWMDEGWATMGEWLIAPMIDSNFVNTYGVAQTAQNSGNEKNQPIITPTTDLVGAESFVNNYPKPGFAYLFLKDMLGEELFIKALHHYIKTWNGKHPSPLDFFNSINEGSGRNLNWFWERWFYQTGIMDLGIEGIESSTDGYLVRVNNNGNFPMTVELTILFEDLSTQTIRRDASIWEDGQKSKNISFSTTKTVKSIKLGSALIPDKNPKNNLIEL